MSRQIIYQPQSNTGTRLTGRVRTLRGLLVLLPCLVLIVAGGANILSRVFAGTATINGADAALHYRQQAKIQAMLAGMTLEQKLGQLIMVEYIGNNYQASGLQTMVTQQFVGGYLYQPVNRNFDAPVNTISSANNFALQAQAGAKTPLLIAIDQEGGQVSKLAGFFGPTPSAAAMAATGNSTTALNQGAQAARWMKQLSINVNLAPVVDVATASPALLQDRIFGKDAQTVTTYAGAFLKGLQNNGVIGTLKHFPGLGSLTVGQDPHNALYTAPRSLSELQNVDFVPYKQLIKQGNPGMIMSTDIVVSAIDPTLPAELSPKVINGTLRTDLGYKGVVITDGLYMKGITARWSIPQAAVLAIAAGNDIVEGPYTVEQVRAVLAAFKGALQTGQLSNARVDEAVQRIMQLKMNYGIIK